MRNSNVPTQGMKTRMIVRCIFSFVACLIGALSTAQAAIVDVSIVDFSFQPATVNINVGDTVRWTQRDNTIHTTTSRTGVWNSGNMSIGRTFSFTFNTAGNFPYICTPHPFMTGTVVVQAVNQPPTVAITSPSNGQQFTAPASVTIEATASDNDGSISKVEFFDGRALVGTLTAPPFRVQVTLDQGAHDLTAKATDNQGASTTSAVVSITVNAPNAAPTVAISSPADGHVLVGAQDVTITAMASDSDGSVAQVEFFDGGTSLGIDSASPFSITRNLAVGTHTLTARATDNLGASATSNPVTVTVRAPNQLPVVSITSPANDAVFTAPATFTVEASASDPDGSIASVIFFANDQQIDVAMVSPYRVTARNLQPGTYVLTAKAIDNENASTVSAGVTVMVKAAAGPARLTNPKFLPNGQFQFTIEGVSRQSYTIEAATELNNFTTLSTVIAPANSFPFTDNNVTARQKFYRVKTE
jgi:plastocyanin